MEAALKALFIAERVAVVRTITGFLPSLATKGAKKAAGDPPDIKPDIETILSAIDFSVWDSLSGQVQPDLEDTAHEATAQVFASLNLSTDSDLFKLADTYALEYAQARAAEMVGKKWVGGVLVDNPNAQWAITDTTRGELRGTIAEAFTENWSPAELAQQIDSSYAFSTARAEMIARTETATAQTAASVNAGKNVGATLKSTQMSNIHDIDDECDDAEAAGEIDIDAWFPDGSLHVPFHPNCMCVELLHIASEAEDDDEE